MLEFEVAYTTPTGPETIIVFAPDAEEAIATACAELTTIHPELAWWEPKIA